MDVSSGSILGKVYEKLIFLVYMGKPWVKIYTGYYDLFKTVREKVL